MRMTREQFEAYKIKEAQRILKNADTYIIDPVLPVGVDIEGKLHKKIIEFCEEHRWPIVHSRMDKKASVTIGAPDFIICAEGGVTLKIECKARKEKPDKDQQTWHQLAAMRGHIVHVIRSYKEFIDIASPYIKLTTND